MLGSTVEEDVMHQCFDEIDRDKSGNLDIEEFIRALRVSYCNVPENPLFWKNERAFSESINQSLQLNKRSLTE